MIVVAHLDHTDECGGAELALARLTRHNPGWSPHIFIPPRRRNCKGAFDEVASEVVVEVGVRQPPGAVTSSFPGRLYLFVRLLQYSLAVRANAQFRKSDVVHANTSRAALIGLVACIASNRRLVIHLRDSLKADALGALNAKLLACAVSRASGVVANSHYTLQTATSHIRPGAVVAVIPSPVGLTEPRAVVPPKPNVTRIGMLARIADWKGQHLLIRAFADGFRATEVTLELAGSAAFGTEHHLEHLKRLAAELGVATQVKFLGHVSDVWPLLDTWDICVHASVRDEPLGQNILQYLAACRPTVASNAGGPAEWIDDENTGLLFEAGCGSELSATLTRLAFDFDLRRRLSQALADKRPVPTDEEIRKQFGGFLETAIKPALHD